jgi:hypothetical protein
MGGALGQVSALRFVTPSAHKLACRSHAVRMLSPSRRFPGLPHTSPGFQLSGFDALPYGVRPVIYVNTKSAEFLFDLQDLKRGVRLLSRRPQRAAPSDGRESCRAN